MLIWVYQYGQLMQVVTDKQDTEAWAQRAAEMFTGAIYFYAELVYEPKESSVG